MSDKLRTVDKSEIAHPAPKSAKDYLSPIEDVLEDIRNGRMVILVDDEDREGDRDLVVGAAPAPAES